MDLCDPVLTSERLSAAGDTRDNVCLCLSEPEMGTRASDLDSNQIF